jgi:hypothetical protein
MSHVAPIDLRIDPGPEGLASLKATALALGGEFREGQKTYAWWGTHVGDYPLPDGFTKDDLGKCEHAIRFPGCPFEVGICRHPDGHLVPLFDFYRVDKLGNPNPLVDFVGGETAKKLRSRYAIERARRSAERTGHVVEEVRQPDGSMKLMAIKKKELQRHGTAWRRIVSKARKLVGVGA